MSLLDYCEIGQRVRGFRKARRLSQEELAEQVGISTTHMSHIETGATKLSLPVLVALAETLEVRTDELLFDPSARWDGAGKEELLSLLEGCSPAEIDVLTDVLRATKQALETYCFKK